MPRSQRSPTAGRAERRAQVILYTDGACSGNPGPGGWAFILKHPNSGKARCESGAEPDTTNNRMELIAAVHGLETLTKSCLVRLVTDSVYVAKGLTEWMPAWKARGWQRREGKRLKPVKNLDLWQRLDELAARHQVTCEVVRGHTGHPENEQCDQMAVDAYRRLMAGPPSDDD